MPLKNIVLHRIKYRYYLELRTMIINYKHLNTIILIFGANGWIGSKVNNLLV